MMGRIQRQSPQVQVDFLRLCCQYWKNEGDLSCEDAQLEAMDSYEALVKYKIIKVENNSITIDFLDAQLDNVEDRRLKASNAGKLSAKSRKRKADAEKRLTESNDRSTTVKQPMSKGATESNRVEESRVEKSREEQQTKGGVSFFDDELDAPIETEFDLFWKAYGKNVGLKQAMNEWANIEKPEYIKILMNVPLYVASKTLKFRKDPANYLSQRTWNDEIITEEAPKKLKPFGGRVVS